MEARFGVRDRFDQRDIRRDESFSMSFAYPVVPRRGSSGPIPALRTTAAELAQNLNRVRDRIALRELINLASTRRARSFEISTALVEVDPPSIPTKPSTTSPGTNFRRDKMPPPIFSLEGCQLVVIAAQAAPAVRPPISAPRSR